LGVKRSKLRWRKEKKKANSTEKGVHGGPVRVTRDDVQTVESF